MKELNFSKNFDKLNRPLGSAITTIRGKGYPKKHKLKPHDEVSIRLNGKKVRKAVVSWIGFFKIKEINEDYLIRDIAPVLFDSRQDFINLLDKLWRWVKVTEETDVSFVFLVLLDHPILEPSLEKRNAIYWLGLTEEQKTKAIEQIAKMSADKGREPTFKVKDIYDNSLLDKRLCQECHKELSGRQRSFCSKTCGNDFWHRFSWPQIRIYVYNKAKARCQDCNCLIDPKGSYDVDHIERITDGGKIFDMDNYQLLCPNCHKKKSKNDYKVSKTEQLKEQGQTFLDDFLQEES